MVNKTELKRMFLARPTEKQAALQQELNMAFYKMAGTLGMNLPASAELTIAWRKLQEAQHYAILALCRAIEEPTPIEKLEEARAKQNPLESPLEEADNWKGPKE